ncbi:MAG: YybH family protein [Gemmatimonadaceae bacterium]
MSRIARVTVLLLVISCQKQVAKSGEGAALLDTDRLWAKIASSGTNVDSVVSFWTDDATSASPGTPVVKGKAALKEMVSGFFGTPGFHISWTPDNAVVAASGDLGYTTGTNEASSPDSTGKITRMVGRYITVWRKGTDGRWRCIEDYSTLSPAERRPHA